MVKGMEAGSVIQPDLGLFHITIPRSVQKALLEAGVIEDWNVGVNSRKCEWVEHRHWAFSAAIASVAVLAGERIVLEAQGLDYSGWIYGFSSLSFL